MSKKKPSNKAEILNISRNGMWILIGDKEFFMPFSEFPWFLKATIEQIYDVELFYGYHLHWPYLDIDIEMASLKNPELYPLKSS